MDFVFHPLKLRGSDAFNSVRSFDARVRSFLAPHGRSIPPCLCPIQLIIFGAPAKSCSRLCCAKAESLSSTSLAGESRFEALPVSANRAPVSNAALSRYRRIGGPSRGACLSVSCQRPPLEWLTRIPPCHGLINRDDGDCGDVEHHTARLRLSSVGSSSLGFVDSFSAVSRSSCSCCQLFLLLCVDGEGGFTSTFPGFHPRINMLKLGVTIWMLVAFARFSIALQAIAQLHQQLAYRGSPHCKPVPQFRRQAARTLAGPA